MDSSWITTSFSTVLMVILSTIGIYVALIVFTRLAGVRSFSKMSSFDFAVTVAIGSLIATTVLTKDPPLLQAIVALAALFVIQIGVASLRSRSLIRGLVDNKAIMLMDGTEILKDNMKKAKVTHADLLAKLREANVTQFSQIKAVVMETTGDISVLHHHDQDHKLDNELLKDLRS
ncbi:MAG: DUF421 domain-containing protein [Balneolaceae bacterium]|nr:DUF421 domain-containing protein [Balneolaceae bacterium]